MRTMHAYSEYLQQYVFETSSLQEGGKFKDDFRVTTVGKFMRKTWIDELPMLINLMRGDLKIVGVRPLSKHYFGLYTPEMRDFRLKFKPGLVPPFYVDLPKTLEEIQESERRYLLAYQKHPFITDFVYFWKALYNILIKKARSN
jgi:lipopolysaccharide/colanic/teichoic acid biosynthesis glycosyltransferase